MSTISNKFSNKNKMKGILIRNGKKTSLLSLDKVLVFRDGDYIEIFEAGTETPFATTRQGGEITYKIGNMEDLLNGIING